MTLEHKSTNNLHLPFNLYALILVVVSVVSGVWLFYTTHLFTTKAEEITQNNIIRLVNIAEYEEKRTVDTAKLILTSLSKNPNISNSNCRQTLKEILAAYPLIHNFGVLDLQGKVICSALDFEGEVYANDRLYFQKTVQTGQFSIGRYQIGKITKKQSINFGYPLTNEDKELTGVVFMAIDLTWLDSLIAKSDLPDKSILYVTDKDGVLLSSYPEKVDVGNFVLETPIVNAILNRSQTAKLASSDGIERVYAFSTANDTGFDDIIITLGVPKTAISQNLNYLFLLNWLFWGVTFTVAFSAGWLVTHKLQKNANT